MVEETSARHAMLRPARAEEAGLLSDLALRAKAHWGYDEAFLAAYRHALTVADDDIANHTVTVAVLGDQPVGFSQLRRVDGAADLTDLWVDPHAIGHGIGRLLWERAVATARLLGAGELRVQSDPHAEGFYRAMGAERSGTQASTVIPGLELPLLRRILR